MVQKYAFFLIYVLKCRQLTTFEAKNDVFLEENCTYKQKMCNFAAFLAQKVSRTLYYIKGSQADLQSKRLVFEIKYKTIN